MESVLRSFAAWPPPVRNASGFPFRSIKAVEASPRAA